MNSKNKIISSILSLLLFNCGILNASNDVEDSGWLNKLEIAHKVTDYLGDFLLIGGAVGQLTGLYIPYIPYDTKGSIDKFGPTNLYLMGTGTLLLLVGAAEKIFISLPLNILSSFLTFLDY